LDYARSRDEQLDRVEPAEIVRSSVALLEAQGVLRQVKASVDVPADLPPIRARAHLLEQALVNLTLNAVDAAPGGRIGVGARRWKYEPGRAEPRRSTDTHATTYTRETPTRPTRVEFASDAVGALIFVADSGPGVPEADRARIFEPFYTTKAPGS